MGGTDSLIQRLLAREESAAMLLVEGSADQSGWPVVREFARRNAEHPENELIILNTARNVHEWNCSSSRSSSGSGSSSSSSRLFDFARAESAALLLEDVVARARESAGPATVLVDELAYLCLGADGGSGALRLLQRLRRLPRVSVVAGLTADLLDPPLHAHFLAAAAVLAAAVNPVKFRYEHCDAPRVFDDDEGLLSADANDLREFFLRVRDRRRPREQRVEDCHADVRWSDEHGCSLHWTPFARKESEPPPLPPAAAAPAEIAYEPPAAAPTELAGSLSFNLGLTEQQRRDREAVQLPHYSARAAHRASIYEGASDPRHAHNRGGEEQLLRKPTVYYSIETVDDYDDEDPDMDLDL